MKKVRCGVVGLGQIGPLHLDAITKVEQTELIAVCDLDEEKAKSYAERYGCAYTTSFEELIAREDIDLVHICLPSGMHADFGCRAAKAGKHVLTEKPIDVSLENADRLIKACREAGVKLSCISQHRFDPDIAYLKRAIDDGHLGRISFGASHTKWYRSQDYYDSGDWRGTWALDGGGALMNQSVHYVDMLQYLCGGIDEVQAYCATLAHERIEVEDVAVAAVRFKSGAIGVLEGNTTAYPGFVTRLDVYGQKGGVIIENDVVKEWKLEGLPAPTNEALGGPSGASSAVIFGLSHQRQIADVAQAILEDRAPLVTGEEARRPLAVILAVYESAKAGKPVRLP
ncbi:MAG: Gfo/Idh/MocA family oxidoreductase [Christensenellaceae bacterium]|jgi:predicted dehydrogenase|nr:Gfo/Idh/MocA family oxidoreductase [Christensenellaceae bacterium]